MPSYYFVLPDVARPTGGVTVTIQLVQLLREAGYDAATLGGDKNYEYAFSNSGHRHFYHAPLKSAPYSFLGKRRSAIKRLKNISNWRPSAICEPLKLTSDSVFVIPEFWYPEYSVVFPNHKKILLSQNVQSFARALQRDNQSKNPIIDQFEAVVSISDATAEAVNAFTNKTSYLVPQSIIRPSLDPTRPKKRQIAFMPRKRREESKLLTDLLKDMPAFADWTIKPIDKMSLSEVDDILSESLIFLSFSRREGFGLPPAEAMAAGSIVVGYTGVGGEEFFLDDTSFKIPDSDITKFASVLESIVVEYDRDPTQLDELRQRAAKTIATKYNETAMRTALLKAWAEIEGKIAE